ncbi:MAG: DUF4282 domain-containing protein [Candidatus Hydrogenedentota bacterium]
MSDFFAFRKMITPTIIQIVFMLWVLGCIIAGVALIISAAGVTSAGLVPGAPDQSIAQIVGGILVLVVGPLVGRIYCELMIVLFMVNEHLAAIRKKVEFNPADFR